MYKWKNEFEGRFVDYYHVTLKNTWLTVVTIVSNLDKRRERERQGK